MWYLSPTTGIPSGLLSHTFGIMAAANRQIGGLFDALKTGCPWMIDNNAFGGNFKESRWLRSLGRMKEFKETCIGVPVPDVVADHAGTLEMFWRYEHAVRSAGYPVAFVSQDGAAPSGVPWDRIDCLFIGGSNEHKLGAEGRRLIEFAKQMGKWVHVGRVNSPKRMRMFPDCDSCDGTSIAREGGEERIRLANRLSNCVIECRESKKGQSLPWRSF